MLNEILICAGIAAGLMLGFVILYQLYIWLDENSPVPMDLIISIFITFVCVTILVATARFCIRKYQKNHPEETKTEILLENGEPIIETSTIQEYLKKLERN